MKKRHNVIQLIVITIWWAAVPSLAKIYAVGGSAGWSLGFDYAAWSSSKTFLIGDSLVFKYGSGHTVEEVTERDYNTCSSKNPINSDNKGRTTILLQTPGPHYFICGVMNHCGSGMKLSVSVMASGGPTPVANSTTTASPETASGYGVGVYPTTMIPDSAASASSSGSLPLPALRSGLIFIFFSVASSSCIIVFLGELFIQYMYIS